MLLSEQKLDPRVKRTRQLLMQAFMQLMEEKSLQSITVQDIADLATVNRATFYAHFDDKYDLMEQMLASLFYEMIESKLLTTCTYSQENLGLLIEAVADFLSKFNGDCHPSDDKYRPLMEAQIQNHIESLLSKWFEELPQTNGALNGSTQITASVLSWAIFGAGIRWAKHSHTLNIEQYSQKVVSIIIDGIPALRKP